MAGVWTGVCVMFPALDAKASGFIVYAVTDASGDPSEMVSRTTLARFAQSGVVPASTNAVICELHRTWKRPEAAKRFPPSAWAFALRIWAAMMVGLYAAFWLQLESASSAAVTVGILALQTRGQVYQKAVYRVLGTISGLSRHL